MAKEKILVIEDDARISMGLEDDLRYEGYEVSCTPSAEEAIKTQEKNTFDLIILDIMLPGMDGFEFLRKIRNKGDNTPVIMLTAKNTEVDKIVGLEIGADDYVTKPFSTRELQARIKALLRRTRKNRNEVNELVRWTFGDIEVDFEKYEIRKRNKIIHLTAYEFSILKLFIQNRNKVLDRFYILDKVWGENVYVTTRSVDTYVAHLRKKLENNHNKPRYILSVHGVGYKFVG
ncbi:MAG TPA: response regulator transcription factor [Caldithrix abyssi]|uniref:Response regulator transcription factor n=1 Tax=Caldithrix abyssi TaxID=187145 RepID=A0A7V4U4Q5_CALAY|nr:response regulator transcription factor [Caldithrix abyssi]